MSSVLCYICSWRKTNSSRTDHTEPLLVGRCFFSSCFYDFSSVGLIFGLVAETISGRCAPLGWNLADVQGCWVSSSNSEQQAPMLKSRLPYRDGKCSYPEFWLEPTFPCTRCLDNFAKHWAHPARWLSSPRTQWGWTGFCPVFARKKKKVKNMYSFKFRPVKINLGVRVGFWFPLLSIIILKKQNGKGQQGGNEWKKKDGRKRRWKKKQRLKA